ncbi:malate synthase G [Neptunicella sp. SCSIO 80796]|uniref:malate synthase G n=1 Tax=Neptunicella plasticusilytica TaxID=3117012 RepID=UPI003A4D3B0A
MPARTPIDGYQIATELYDFVNLQVLPGLDLEQDAFWSSAMAIFSQFIPRNQQLLLKRQQLQQQIDDWHIAHKQTPFDPVSYQQFLTDIGYIVPQGDDFTISTENVDVEIASIAGPQLVVPLMNARFALNAANARWGSLYDALYGTDVISRDKDNKATSGYDPVRGNKVIAFARQFLDQSLPLAEGSHADVSAYTIENQQLLMTLTNGQQVQLAQPQQFVGFNGSLSAPSAVLCCHHGLHMEIQIDRQHIIGQSDLAGVKDVVLESALTTIQDCEDSIAAVDSSDKVAVYKNWLGLMKGDLTEQLVKQGKTVTRRLNPDREYQALDGTTLSLPGRSLQFIRNVGHLMTTEAILTPNDEQVPEGILDGIITSLIALHDLNGLGQFNNSQTGSIYIVKPKMHGPDEVQFSCDLFGAIEHALGLAANTIKMGIMDEERRTSVNLKECIRAAKQRVVFINTGFLDRTGDEIHTSMLAGAMLPKDQMKDQPWLQAYENRNVLIGLQTGLMGKAQIGKGMWAIPDQMADMLAQKIAHPKSGANCAWVPSPTAATLHALHYHQVNVQQVQQALLAKPADMQLNQLLTLPLLDDPASLTAEVIQKELDNNIQGLLGYVVRWVDQGIGCSKVPDIDNIGRMEDRATLRISSQHIANWLEHDVIDESQIIQALQRMSKIVDGQNAADELYHPMSADFDNNIAFNAAKDLIFKGKEQPSGYTEPLLHQSRIKVKQGLLES